MGYYDRNMKARPDRVKSEDTWQGYINASLTKQYLDAFEIWLRESNDDIFSELERDLSDGSRLSVKFDEKNSAYVATLTSSKDGQYNLRGTATLSAFAESIEAAIALLMFKHIMYLERDWSKEITSNGSAKRG